MVHGQRQYVRARDETAPRHASKIPVVALVSRQRDPVTGISKATGIHHVERADTLEPDVLARRGRSISRAHSGADGGDGALFEREGEDPLAVPGGRFRGRRSAHEAARTGRRSPRPTGRAARGRARRAGDLLAASPPPRSAAVPRARRIPQPSGPSWTASPGPPDPRRREMGVLAQARPHGPSATCPWWPAPGASRLICTGPTGHGLPSRPGGSQTRPETAGATMSMMATSRAPRRRGSTAASQSRDHLRATGHRWCSASP